VPSSGPAAPSASIDLLSRAVEIDPRFASAWAELVRAYGAMAFTSIRSPEEQARVVADMERAAAQAISTGRDRWETQTAIASLRVAQRRWLEADRAISRARELAPGGGPGMGFDAWSYELEVGRLEDALVTLSESRKIDPLGPGGVIAIRNITLLLGRPAAAPGEMAREAAARRDELSLYLVATWALAQGDVQLAAGALDSIASFAGGNDPMYGELARALRSPKTLRDLLRESAPESGPLTRFELVRAAHFAAYLGDAGLAMRRLYDAYLETASNIGGWLIWVPVLADVRKTDAFKAFLRDIGLVELWRETGRWGDFCRPTGPDDFECT
jgi:hypothetical protein